MNINQEIANALSMIQMFGNAASYSQFCNWLSTGMRAQISEKLVDEAFEYERNVVVMIVESSLILNSFQKNLIKMQYEQMNAFNKMDIKQQLANRYLLIR